MEITFEINQAVSRSADGVIVGVMATPSATINGAVVVGAQTPIPLRPPVGDIVPYAEVTEPQLQGWVRDALHPSMLQRIEGQLLAKAPSTTSAVELVHGLPWSNV